MSLWFASALHWERRRGLEVDGIGSGETFRGRFVAFRMACIMHVEEKVSRGKLVATQRYHR